MSNSVCCICGHSESDHLNGGICLFGSGAKCQCVLFTSSPAIAWASRAGNAGERPATDTLGATPGDPKNVVIEVKVGERLVYRATVWQLVTVELLELGGTIDLSGPHKVFANGVEQDEQKEDWSVLGWR